MLKAYNLPSRGLSAALKRAPDPAAAVTLSLTTPNLPGTWAPVKRPAHASAALIQRYVDAELLRYGEDHRLYARVSDPSVIGTDPQHNRCLGADSCMSKGTGTFEPVSVKLPDGSQAKVAWYQDPDAARSYHVFKGVLTADQAKLFVDKDYRKLFRSLKRELAAPDLRELVHKHRLNVNIIPNDFLTLELEAFPVAAENPSSLRALGRGLATVADSVQRERPDLVWLKPDAYWKIARLRDTETHNPRAVVQLYSANHASIRSGSMAGKGQAMSAAVDTMPALIWSAKYNPSQAAVTIGWWAPFFADYGWGIRRERGGQLRVYELASGRPLVVNGSAQQGSLQAARVLSEGNAVVSGLVLRSYWRADLTPVGLLGGTPFQMHNTNPRSRLDHDTNGPAAAPRPITTVTTEQLSKGASRMFDLTRTTDRSYWKSRVGKNGSPLAGVIAVTQALGLDQPEWEHGQKLLKRIARGDSLDKISMVAMPEVENPSAAGKTAR